MVVKLKKTLKVELTGKNIAGCFRLDADANFSLIGFVWVSIDRYFPADITDVKARRKAAFLRCLNPRRQPNQWRERSACLWTAAFHRGASSLLLICY